MTENSLPLYLNWAEKLLFIKRPPPKAFGTKAMPVYTTFLSSSLWIQCSRFQAMPCPMTKTSWRTHTMRRRALLERRTWPISEPIHWRDPKTKTRENQLRRSHFAFSRSENKIRRVCVKMSPVQPFQAFFFPYLYQSVSHAVVSAHRSRDLKKNKK